MITITLFIVVTIMISYLVGCIHRDFDVRHIPACDGGIYLTRITLLRAFGGKLMINVFRKSDERELHDHPWNFWSLIIWRGYIETRAFQGDYASSTITDRVFPGMILRRRTWDTHRVQLVNNKPAVSLVWRGPHRRDWGFHTPDQGWVQHNRWWFLRGCHEKQQRVGDKDNE